MREKNGFIATSILYSFFLVFITLFVSLIANYMHNQILIKTMNEEVKKDLCEVDDKNLYNMNVGEYIKFVKADNLDEDNKWVLGLFDDGFNWTLVDSKDVGNNKKLTFISDIYSQTVNTKIGNDKTPVDHYVTIDLFNKLNDDIIEVGEEHVNPFSLALMYAGENDLSIVSSDLINQISRSNILSDLMKNKIFATTSSYAIYDETNDKYFNYELKGFASDSDKEEVKTTCLLKDDEFNYNDDNLLGYRNIVDDSINEIKYVNYCTVTSDITNITSPNYNLRLMMTIETSKDNNYIMSGHGTSVDPYLFTSGVK